MEENVGEVVERITLVNAGDAIMARRGIIKASEVRQLTVDAVVGTGVRPLVISEAMRQKLGLEIEEEDAVLLIGGVPQTCTVAELVDIHWQDRYTASRPTVLPTGSETFLGVNPLEDMDLLVNPVERRLEGAHGDQRLRKVRGRVRRQLS
jgi:predicted aspartyl protease